MAHVPLPLLKWISFAQFLGLDSPAFHDVQGFTLLPPVAQENANDANRKPQTSNADLLHEDGQEETNSTLSLSELAGETVAAATTDGAGSRIG